MARYNLENNPLFATPEAPDQEAAEEKTAKRGRPQSDNVVRGNSVQEGLTAEYTRATFIVQVDLLEKFKNYAYTERLSMKEAINKVLKEALEREEKKLSKNGEAILDRKGAK